MARKRKIVNYNDLLLLVEQGYTIREASLEIGISIASARRNLSNPQWIELKAIKATNRGREVSNTLTSNFI